MTLSSAALPLLAFALLASTDADGAGPRQADAEAPHPPQLAQREPLPYDVDAAVERLQTTYDGIRDLQADFTQESLQIALGDTRVSTGEVYFLRPGMMVWDYHDERRLVLDGQHLHSVDIANQQYYSAPVDQSDLPTAMRFLLGQGRLADDFRIALLPESTAERAVLELVPVVPAGEYERLAFVVDTASWTVVETTIVDPAGNTNTIRFQGIETNVGMTADTFAFAPPRGFTRIDVPD